MKILYLITKSNWYGAQKYTHQLATSFLQQGQEVLVCYGGGGVRGDEEPGLLRDRLTEDRVRHVYLARLSRDVSLLNDIYICYALYCLYRRESPDVVHLSSSKAGGIGALAARIAGVPRIIFTSHGLAYDEARASTFFGGFSIRVATWVTFLLCHAVIMISKDTHERARSLPWCKNRVHLVYNSAPVDTVFVERIKAREQLAPGLDASIPWMGTIAELTENKRIDTLIQAAALLKRRGVRFAMCLIGEGEEKESLVKLGQDEGVDGITSFAGYVPDAARYLKALDLFVLPSMKEGLPYVLLEAGRAGCAVVASDIPGNTDIVTDQETGLLFPVGDVSTLASALSLLLGDGNFRQKLKNGLQGHVERDFNTVRMLDQTLALYQD